MKIEIKTTDGVCPAYVSKPSGQGPWPAALVLMDGIGIRPAMLEIGEKLATHGFYVLLPDLYWRAGPYEPLDAKAIFTNPEGIKMLRE
jgi:carboxymethylenebutenolidase